MSGTATLQPSRSGAGVCAYCAGAFSTSERAQVVRLRMLQELSGLETVERAGGTSSRVEGLRNPRLGREPHDPPDLPSVPEDHAPHGRRRLDLTVTNQRVLLHRARTRVRQALEQHMRGER